VMAATVGTSDHMLWILDEGYDPVAGWVARLVRISLWTFEHEVVWEGPRTGYNDTHWLTVDHDGQVLLTSSSQWLTSHITVRFEADPYVLGTAVPTAIYYGNGPLLTAPLVDADG